MNVRLALFGLSIGMLPSLLPAEKTASAQDAEAWNREIGRGINLGNALDAPSEGQWGVTLQAEYFQRIKEAGLSSVRIPVRWSAHSATNAPFTIDPVFMQRVDWAVSQALSRKLVAILNIHHFDELTTNPVGEAARFVSLWEQIALHFKNTPDALLFELLNEPHDKLTNERWNGLLDDAIKAIRRSNPDRILVIGPGGWNNLHQLQALKLPKGDRRIIATFHYYEPFHFTHQGAGWVKGSAPWLGTRWGGTDVEAAAVRKDLDKAAAWATAEGRPLFLGEFGAYSKADAASRAAWTRFVRTEAEKRGMSWAYWEFCSGFGAYDPLKKEWRKSLLDALTDTGRPSPALLLQGPHNK